MVHMKINSNAQKSAHQDKPAIYVTEKSKLGSHIRGSLVLMKHKCHMTTVTVVCHWFHGSLVLMKHKCHIMTTVTAGFCKNTVQTSHDPLALTERKLYSVLTLSLGLASVSAALCTVKYEQREREKSLGRNYSYGPETTQHQHVYISRFSCYIKIRLCVLVYYLHCYLHMQALLYCMHLMHSYTYNCSTLINHIPGELNI